MAEIWGNTVGIPIPRANWKQTDEKESDFIMGKPDITQTETEIKFGKPIDMASHKVTGIADASGDTDVPSFKQAKDEAVKAAKTAVNGAYKQVKATLTVGGWGKNQEQTIDVEGLTETCPTFPSYDPADDANVTAYLEAGIYAKTQAAGKLTWRWRDAKPEKPINVVIGMEVGAK